MQLGFHDGLTTHRRGGCTDEDRSGEELVNELYRRKAKRTDRKTNSNGIKKPIEEKDLAITTQRDSRMAYRRN